VNAKNAYILASRVFPAGLKVVIFLILLKIFDTIKEKPMEDIIK
jgi:hypothetical protein